MVSNELPRRENKRRGPGWWMDLDGVWRPPSVWPHDDPPLEGWQRAANGEWQPPLETDASADSEERTVAILEIEESSAAADASDSLRSRQAQADRRAMFLVAGALGAAALLLAVALILITQAGADDAVVETEVENEVLYAAETDAVRDQRRVTVAALAPDAARTQLLEIETRPTETGPREFFEDDWVVVNDDCLDTEEEVLVERSRQPITWADELECVPDQGRWVDRNLGTTITRTIDAEVVPHVPSVVAFVSGAHEWTAQTRQAYLTDIRHPATLQVVSKGSGHNPRNQDPSEWKPSSESAWCAYAVDWVAVKHRWELDVSVPERAALIEMLDTCDAPESIGADPITMLIDAIGEPVIERIIAE